MWRKPDEPKASSPAGTPPTFEPVAPRVEVPSAAPAAPVTPATNSANRVVSAAPAAGSVLTNSLIIKGEISGHEDLYVDGEMHGKIQILDGKVTVGPQGRVSADIEAREILVRGKVQGSLHGRERVEIAATGDVSGDVIARRLVIEEGATVQGSIEVERPATVNPPPVVRVVSTEAARSVAFETAESKR
ncbi:MAG: polymer-forming cytoskeletal protein [Candidatus Acidiferrales bacterium]